MLTQNTVIYSITSNDILVWRKNSLSLLLIITILLNLYFKTILKRKKRNKMYSPNFVIKKVVLTVSSRQLSGNKQAIATGKKNLDKGNIRDKVWAVVSAPSH